MHYSHMHLYYDASAMILVIVTIGKLIENLSKRKAQKSLQKLVNLKPKIAHLYKDNTIFDVESKFLKKNDMLELAVTGTDRNGNGVAHAPNGMTVFIRKFHNLVFDRLTITWTSSFDHT